MTPLTKNEYDTIESGAWLDSDIMSRFGQLLASHSDYRMQDTWKVQIPHLITEHSKNEKYIQILHSSDNMNTNTNGHWVCAYYDTKSIFIYDSLQGNRVHPHHKLFLDRVFPNYPFISKPIQFPPLKKQPNSNDCGVYAIAYAVSLLNNINPKDIEYQNSLMRPHLLRIFQTGIISHFPCISTPNNIQIEIRKRQNTLSLQNVKDLSEREMDITENNNFNIIEHKIPTRCTKNKKKRAAPDPVIKPTNSEKKKNRKKKKKLNDNIPSDYLDDPTCNDRKSSSVTNVDSANQTDNNKLKRTKRVAENDEASQNHSRNKKTKMGTSPVVQESSQNNNKEKSGSDRNPQWYIDQQRLRWHKKKEAVNKARRLKYLADKAKNGNKKQTKILTLERQKQSKPVKRIKIQGSQRKRSSETNRKLISARIVLHKYNLIRNQANRINLECPKHVYITRLSKKLKSKFKSDRSIEAERIIKWCYHLRNKLVYRIKKLLHSMKEKADFYLTKLSKCEGTNIADQIIALCGSVKKHKASSEPYFAETSYMQPLDMTNPIIMNMNGQALNILPISSELKKPCSKFWNCTSLCRSPDLEIIDRYIRFLKMINCCSMYKIKTVFSNIHKCSKQHRIDKLGHSHVCYIVPTQCKSLFISLEFLSPHFPMVRRMKQLFYQISLSLKKVATIDHSLNTTDITALEKILKEAIENAMFFRSASKIIIDEDEIKRQYRQAFRDLEKKSSDVPRLACMSCDKIYCKKDIHNVQNLRTFPKYKIWQDLLQLNKIEGNSCVYICKYCLNKFRSGNVPPTCILNELKTDHVPDVLKKLNDYEKIFIQRAKAFQTVVKMDTVSKKNIPHKARVNKMKGRTIHLPLPIEETFAKMCPDIDPINKNHELYILVRGVPTNSKKVWESLVDVKKIYNALKWLKEHNPLYVDIKLPMSPEEMLNSQLCEDALGDIIQSSDHANDPKPAFITQISQTNPFYEQVTIFPMHAEKENKTSTELYQMLKIQDVPLDNRHKYLDLKCFPDLYPYGMHGQFHDRSINISHFEYVKSKLMSKHSRYRLNQQYLFYLFNDHNLRQINSGIFHKMTMTDTRFKYTAGGYLDQLLNGQLEGNLNTVFAKLRNTEQYWNKPRNELNCMIRHYGPPTWFLTLTPAEWCWSNLEKYLRELNPHIHGRSISELVAADPVSTSRFIEIQFQAMLSFICSKSIPIGKVTHYFWRREYQGRGIQHFHMLIWIKGAPILGNSSKEDVVEFLNKYLTCTIPHKDISPTLHRRVTTHQYHHHNSYCMRSKLVNGKNKDKKAKVCKKVCRFLFPKLVTDEWIIRNVETSIAGRRKLKLKTQLYDNPRTIREVFINNYNPAILTAWEGNMDISFVGEKSAALGYYVTKYLSKAEKTAGQDIFDQVSSTKSLHSRIWNFALRALSNRECGALEAADTLLGNSLYGTDSKTTVKWVDVNLIRTRKLKPRKVLENLSKNSTEIYYHGVVDYYYPQRPTELNKVNLYDFVQWYDVVKIKPSGKNVEYYKFCNNLYLKKRKRGYLINHYMYDVKTKPESYFYSLLLLFQPWRDSDELKNGCDTYTKSFYCVLPRLTIALQYHERLSEIENNMSGIKEQIEKCLDDMDKEEGNESPVDDILIGIEANNAMQNFKDINDKENEINIDDLIADLNDDQLRIFKNITETVQANKILRLYVSGEGGTGKSFLIKTVKCWLKQEMNEDTAVTAPTGIAAFNVNGLTVHRLLQLPVEHGDIPKYKPLSDIVLKTIRDQLKNMSLVIIDEVSMVSNVMLMYIHLRLTEIFNTAQVEDGWFGKKHVILFGDLLQLPPVLENPAFVKLSKISVNKFLGSLGTINLWSSLFQYDELNINMRQKNDSSYREMLSRIRLGFVNTEDCKALSSRKIPFSSINFNDRISELCKYIEALPIDTVCLLPTCQMCDVLNNAMLNRLPSPEIKLDAIDIIDCSHLIKAKATKKVKQNEENTTRTAGLSTVINVKIGAKIMIRRNIDATMGLVNGTIGTIVCFCKNLDGRSIEKVRIRLATMQEFDIERVTVKFQVMENAFVMRKQFPLCLSYGITIHKSQGLSLQSAVIDAGNSIFLSGQIYVALSRVTSLNGLHLINFDPHNVKADPSAVSEYNRLRAHYRPDLMKMNAGKQKKREIKDTLWAVIPQYDINFEDDKKDKSDNNKSFRPKKHINGFSNDDGVSCYANVTIQCIFHLKCVQKAYFNNKNNLADPLNILFQQYIANAKITLSTRNVREFIGGSFNMNVQQDVPEFFTSLYNKLTYLKDLIKHTLISKIMCKQCGYTYTSEMQSNYILIINVPNRKLAWSLQELIDNNLSKWTKINSRCNNCSATETYMQYNVASVQKTIAIQFSLVQLDEKTNKLEKLNSLKIKSVTNATFHLCGNSYKVSSAIFHHGNNVETGHYTCMIKEGYKTWFYVNDSIIEKKCWPKNSKECYMIFVEQK